MKLLILAGGFGTRLSSVLSGVPKVLAPIGNKTFLELIVQNWRTHGIRDFAFLLHHKAEIVEQYIEENNKTLFDGCNIEIIIEPEPLGTGGSIAHALTKMNTSDSFLVINADTWMDHGLLDVARIPGPSMGVIKIEDASRFGGVIFDNKNLVTAFLEKDKSKCSGWINAGIYHLNAEIFSGWKGEQCSLERDIFPRLVNEKKLIAVPITNSGFIDIGIPADYIKFVKRFK
jgi:D-glycero-alpha-D-manno-heptose 1-phosphate guanylyltransferase